MLFFTYVIKIFLRLGIHTIPAVNVNIGRKMILSRMSGYCVQINPRTPIIAPD